MSQPTPATPPPVAHLEFKAGLLLVLLALLLVGSIVYVMYARGVFEATQTVVLITDDSEGVRPGMDLTFSGFPIGRVRRIELGADGNARIVIDVPRRDAHWLRESSVFTLTRNLVGGTSIKAYSGIPSDPPLPDGAERKVLAGDASAEIPRLVAAAKELVQNLTTLTAADGPLAASLASVQAVTDDVKKRGALGVLFGNDADAKKVVVALDRTNALLARLDAVVAKADTQVFGADGVMSETRGTIIELRAALADARATLKQVDALLVETQGVASNVRGATTDLGPLRAEIEVNLRKIEGLVDQINRKWPFARDTELKLP
jgi:phospholipid/cholesterol/gamma-HCH transport system substrate-binding protein